MERSGIEEIPDSALLHPGYMIWNMRFYGFLMKPAIWPSNSSSWKGFPR